MAGDFQNTNKFAIGLELGIYIIALILVILDRAIGFSIPLITFLSYIAVIGGLIYFLFIFLNLNLPSPRILSFLKIFK